MKLRHAVIAALPLCFAPLAGAQSSDPSGTPDVQSNPTTGSIEVVDSVSTATGRDIRLTVDHGSGTDRQIELLTSTANDDLDPRIGITAGGDTCIAWWRHGDPDEIRFRRKNHTDGLWSADLRVSLAGEGSRRPAIAATSLGIWIAYEFDAPAGRTVGVVSISDGPEPFPDSRMILATTGFTGDLKTMVLSESNQLWVEWIDSPSTLGWSVYDPGTAGWSAPLTEPFESESLDEARERVRAQVLNP